MLTYKYLYARPITCFDYFIIGIALVVLAWKTFNFIRTKKRSDKTAKCIDSFARSKEFLSLEDGEEKQNLKEILLLPSFLGSPRKPGITFNRCYVKRAGEASLYISHIVRKIITDPRHLPEVSRLINFFGLIETNIPFKMAVYHKDKYVTNEGFSRKLDVKNGTNEFNSYFSVRTMDQSMTEITVPEEIQKIFINYREEYPLSYKGSEDRAYVFLGRRGISITTPQTEEESDLMPIFEMGTELTELMKQ